MPDITIFRFQCPGFDVRINLEHVLLRTSWTLEKTNGQTTRNTGDPQYWWPACHESAAAAEHRALPPNSRRRERDKSLMRQTEDVGR